MTGIASVDLAVTSPCPSCGTPVRRFAATPIAGNGLDATRSGPWTCDVCLSAKCKAAADAVRAKAMAAIDATPITGTLL